MSIVIPNINDALISEEKLTLKESENRYIELLDAVSHAKHANKIREYQDITNLTNLHKFNSDCMELIKYLNKWKKKMGYRFPISIIKRKKSLYKFDMKIRLFRFKNRDLSEILDALGMRIILGTGKMDTFETVKYCYEVFNEIIHFFADIKHYCPETAEIKISTENFDFKKFPNVFVPKETDFHILPGYEINTKNYIIQPKSKTAYQSLHIVFRNCKGQPIEIQVRTEAMDIQAEYTTKHDEHDQDTYPDDTPTIVPLNRELINVYGYTVLDTGEILDYVGVEKAVDPSSLII